MVLKLAIAAKIGYNLIAFKRNKQVLIASVFLSFSMKTLYVIRHAKSSWVDTDLPDFDRPLNERGKRDAPRMGKRLKEKSVHPDLLLSSPAKRALSTCKRIAETLDYPKDGIKTDRDLYHADEDEILSVVRRISDKYSTVFIFGHNPGLTDFVNSLSRDEAMNISNLPTCGVAAFSFEIDSWKMVDFGKGNFLFFDYPKSKED
jgi:phosphohistidine phosphatase